ncbi:hypothetical protein ACKWMY_23520 [Serratia sp. J2]|uniref:hypothetical protein n=1 Tax=Serratia sp. J2 TaxID=3386551 RepID=UPI00391736BB
MSDEQLASDAALQQFIDLSRLLTGFDRFELLGTGQAAFYYDWVQTHAAERFATLLATYGELPADAAQHSSFVETRLLGSEKLSTLVTSIIKLLSCCRAWHSNWISTHTVRRSTAFS